MPWNYQFLFLLLNFSGNSGKSGKKNFFADRQTANTVLLFVAIKGRSPGKFFSEHVTVKTNSPEKLHTDYLINIAT